MRERSRFLASLRRRACLRKATIALGVLCLSAHGQSAEAQAPAAWPAESWNPQPMPDDLVLPLPCGGSMAFRPVLTPMPPGALADRQIVLGWSNTDTDYSEFLRRSFIAGGFAGPTPNAPHRYYIAKYEVTVDQYAALSDAGCSALPSAAGRMPKGNVAWHEAVDYTVRLSSWLLKNAKQALPKAGEALAFVRLPTEDEWEYAARGGSKVAELEFSAPTFPMPDGLRRYAWFQGTRSANGAAHPVGSLQPNPLGLFDVLGNLSEWTIEPYRLNKVGRAHGLAGSAVARGGDYFTPDQRINTALRIEVPAFNTSTGEPMRQSRIGLRPVLARSTTGDDNEVLALQKAFADEARSNASAADNPVELLKLLRREVPDEKTRAGLERIEATMQTANREIKEKDALVLRGVIKTAAQAARQIVVQRAFEEVSAVYGKAQLDATAVQEGLIAKQEQLATSVRDEYIRNALRSQEQQMRAAAQSYEAIRKKIAAYVSKTSADTRAALAAEYLRIVALAASTADAVALDREGKVVIQEFEPQSRGGFLVVFTKVAVDHMKLALAGKLPTSEQAENDLVAAANAVQRAQGR